MSEPCVPCSQNTNPCAETVSPCVEIVNPCYKCGCTEACNCETPSYTSTVCADGSTTTNCVSYSGVTDTCIGITQNTSTLSNVLTKLIAYIKSVRTRFISDGSLTITPIADNCSDKARIGLKIKTGANGLTLTPDGLFVTPGNGVVIANGSCITFTKTTLNGVDTYTPTINLTCLSALLCPMCTPCDTGCAQPAGLIIT